MITESVEIKTPICESEREKVFRVTGPPVSYRVEAVCPDGTTKIFENVRAYTKSLTVNEAVGRIEMVIDSEHPSIRQCRVIYPYHYLHREKILCVLKNFDVRLLTSDGSVRGFALNYNLFEMPWQLCLVLHKAQGELLSFMTSRAEWDRGMLTAENREVQMFLKIPEERSVPANLMEMVVDPSIALWMGNCKSEIRRKNL
jgi:hypothetical protein